MIKKELIVILDMSAFLSGKPININNGHIVTTPRVSKELNPGGKDYRNFQFLKEKGLDIYSPSKESKLIIDKITKKSGDIDRLSDADKEILALAVDLINKHEVIILTDDYSIQNVANILNIKFENISQHGITKRFKWGYRCRGCGKKFKENIKICPICGTATKDIVSSKKNIKK
jgi:UPF0271 protein